MRALRSVNTIFTTELLSCYSLKHTVLKLVFWAGISIVVLPRNAVLSELRSVWAIILLIRVTMNDMMVNYRCYRHYGIMHNIVLLDGLVLVVGVLMYGGCDWCRVVFWIIVMISIVAVPLVNMSRDVSVFLVEARGILVVSLDIRMGCFMMYYLMAKLILIGCVTILMQVFNVFFIRSVSATDVIVFYLVFCMHLISRMMAMLMSLKLLHPAGCSRIVLGMVRLFERMRLYLFCFSLIVVMGVLYDIVDVMVMHGMQGITMVDQFSVVVYRVKVLD